MVLKYIQSKILQGRLLWY